MALRGTGAQFASQPNFSTDSRDKSFAAWAPIASENGCGSLQPITGNELRGRRRHMARLQAFHELKTQLVDWCASCVSDFQRSSHVSMAALTEKFDKLNQVVEKEQRLRMKVEARMDTVIADLRQEMRETSERVVADVQEQVNNLKTVLVKGHSDTLPGALLGETSYMKLKEQLTKAEGAPFEKEVEKLWLDVHDLREQIASLASSQKNETTLRIHDDERISKACEELHADLRLICGDTGADDDEYGGEIGKIWTEVTRLMEANDDNALWREEADDALRAGLATSKQEVRDELESIHAKYGDMLTEIEESLLAKLQQQVINEHQAVHGDASTTGEGALEQCLIKYGLDRYQGDMKKIIAWTQDLATRLGELHDHISRLAQRVECLEMSAT